MQTLIDQALEKAAGDLAEYAIKAAQRELRAQGHVLTGSLVSTMGTRVVLGQSDITAQVLMNHYAPYLERALPASRVPYSPGSGAKSSKVVDALLRYWKLRGLAPKEARSATFATLNKWKQEGRPTRASFRFSRNGRRLGFLERTVETVNENAADILLRGAGSEIEKNIVKSLRATIRSGFA